MCHGATAVRRLRRGRRTPGAEGGEGWGRGVRGGRRGAWGARDPGSGRRGCHHLSPWGRVVLWCIRIDGREWTGTGSEFEGRETVVSRDELTPPYKSFTEHCIAKGRGAIGPHRPSGGWTHHCLRAGSSTRRSAGCRACRGPAPAAAAAGPASTLGPTSLMILPPSSPLHHWFSLVLLLGTER